MTVLESAPTRRSLRSLVRFRAFGEEWSLSDWIVGGTSIVLALASAGFFTVSYVISIRSPGYFQDAALASLQPRLDPLTTGSLPALGDAMPGQRILRGDLRASDYQIVMVFGDEALLATGSELLRVKVGSVLPGLGTISAIAPEAGGGTVTGDLAVLRSAPPATAAN